MDRRIEHLFRRVEQDQHFLHTLQHRLARQVQVDTLERSVQQ